MAGASPQISRSLEPVVRVTLAVSGRHVALRPFNGHDDVLLAQGRADDPALALRLVGSVAQADDALDLAALPIPDVDALIVRLRQRELGDRVVAHVACAGGGCGRRVDMAFRLSDYLDHHRPKPRGAARVRAAPERGDVLWLALSGNERPPLEFRLPAFADLVAVEREADRAGALAALCLGGVKGARERRRALRALEALAPPLAGPIQGRCPDCGASIDAHFDARAYCLQELCERARFVYEDVDALAAAYHWSEADILDLPSERRHLYAERARRARAG